jgi:catechol 2,3-dioxygenase-like lactoylglutathione lyase family enzyme
MSLSRYQVTTSIAVSDVARAAEFYEGKLGLAAAETQPDESRISAWGGGTSATATLATWYVTDLEDVLEGLGSDGVTFERYDDPALKADKQGIHELGDGRVVWFSDPDGNTFAIEEGTTP